jgi:amino acid transporter
VNRPDNDGTLVRAVGTAGLAASIVNITIGGGIFRLPAVAAATLGSAAPLAYLVCAVAMALIVMCFAEAGSRVSLTGGVYAYVEVAFGPLAGFITGVLLWAGMTAAFAAVTSFFGDALVALAPGIASARTGVSIAILAALATLNVAGVRGANRFNAVMTAAKLVPLVLLIVVGFASVRAANVAIAAPPSSGSLARASSVLIFAFFGVESALVPSGEVRDPARTVPRAILIAMIVVTATYLLVQIVAQGILGAALAGQTTPLSAAAGVAMGPAGRLLVLVGMAVSMFGYVSGMTLAVPRALFAFARDGFLPRVLAAVHPRFRTPYVAIMVQTCVVAALAVSGSFERLAIIANGSMLIVYAGCCLAVLRLRRLDVRGERPPFRAPASGAVPVLAFAIIVWMLGSLSLAEWTAMAALVVAALVLYLATRTLRRVRDMESAA